MLLLHQLSLAASKITRIWGFITYGLHDIFWFLLTQKEFLLKSILLLKQNKMIPLKNYEYALKNLGVCRRQQGLCVPGEREPRVSPLHSAVREMLQGGRCCIWLFAASPLNLTHRTFEHLQPLACWTQLPARVTRLAVPCWDSAAQGFSLLPWQPTWRNSNN